MGNYKTVTDNLIALKNHTGGTESWSLDQVLALAQIQATLAVAEALEAKEK